MIELLTSIGVIAVLATLISREIVTAKGTSKRVRCMSNLKQLGYSSIMYSGDDAKERYSNTFSDSNDDQTWLCPSYIPSADVFRCPATRNAVRLDRLAEHPILRVPAVLDLLGHAGQRSGFGSSYEVYGYMNYNGPDKTDLVVGGEVLNVPGVQKTQATVQTYEHKSAAFGYAGRRPGPANIWLFLDGSSSNGNEPSNDANHGRAGLNVLFCDGRAEWVRARDWARSYELSQDEGIGLP